MSRGWQHTADATSAVATYCSQDEVAAALMAQLGGRLSGQIRDSQEILDQETCQADGQEPTSAVGLTGDARHFTSLQQALRFVTAPVRGRSVMSEGLRRQQVR